jgi:hypothetical protein
MTLSVVVVMLVFGSHIPLLVFGSGPGVPGSQTVTHICVTAEAS